MNGITNSLNYIEIKKKYPHVPTFSQFCIEIPPKTKILLDIKGDNNTALKMVEFFKLILNILHPL